MVTLPDHPNIEIDYEDLLRLYKRGFKKYYLPKADLEIDVVELINGIDDIAMTKYHLSNIHTLLITAFPAEDLQLFCFLESDFRPVYDKLSSDAGKDEIALELIRYAEQQLKIPKLLEWAEKQNPARYKLHGPYSSDE